MRKYSRLVMMTVVSMLVAGCQKNQEPDHLELGKIAIEQESYQEALTEFQEAVQAEEDKIRAYRGIGMAYMGLEQYEQAVISFDQAFAETKEKMTKARKDLLYYKASALYHEEKYEETIQVCNQILEKASEADAFYLRGACYLKEQKMDKAQVDFEAALKQQPEDYELYLNIYESFQEQKLSAKGDEYLQQALQIESNRDEDTYHKARIYYTLENYQKAQELLKGLVEEKNPEAMLLMGEIYLKKEESEKSIAMYQQYMQENEETPEAYNGIVLAELAQNRYDEALADIAKGLALEKEKGKQELYFNEIVAYEYKGDFENAKIKAFVYSEKYPMDERGKKEYDFLSNR